MLRINMWFILAVVVMYLVSICADKNITHFVSLGSGVSKLPPISQNWRVSNMTNRQYSFSSLATNNISPLAKKNFWEILKISIENAHSNYVSTNKNDPWGLKNTRNEHIGLDIFLDKHIPFFQLLLNRSFLYKQMHWSSDDICGK